MSVLRVLTGAAVVLSLSCVTYDFEPVDPYGFTIERISIPTAGTIPPNVMLVIDKSGSMDLPMAPSDPDCGACGQNKGALCNPATCSTRWSELQLAMNAFLPTSKGIARFGLVTYPADAVCGAPGTVRVPIPSIDDWAQLLSHAQTVNSVIQGISSQGTSGTPNTTGGGTPTARALKLLHTEPTYVADDTRGDVAILLTDGLPNCNANNPNSFTSNPTACRCTLGADCSAYPREGCLDDSATIAEIQALKARKITVVVIGFGAEVSTGPGPEVLRALAAAGGHQRKCSSNAECAVGDTCNQRPAPESGVCSTGLYLPTNGAELAEALRLIAQPNDPCVTLISESADPAAMQVKVGERLLDANEWTLSGSQVTVKGTACEELRNARPDRTVEFSVWALREVPTR